jgi:hypothetical protein
LKEALMLFSSFLPSVSQPDSVRLALLDAILLDCKKAFPDLHFELRLDRKVVNAQAILLDEKRCVLIYGGLALHPSLAEASLTFAFLHEAGHHLATGPRSPFNVTLKCDCAADRWATTEGAETLRRVSGRQLEIAVALQELDCLISELGDVPDSSEEFPSTCWNGQWSQRKQGIAASVGRLLTRCELMRPSH